MEMRYFWVKHKYYKVFWHPGTGTEILAGCPSKHHDHEAKHHQNVNPFHLHKNNYSLSLRRALSTRAMRDLVSKSNRENTPPSDWQGCVGIRSCAPGGYVPGQPLLIIPRYRPPVQHVATAAQAIVNGVAKKSPLRAETKGRPLQELHTHELALDPHFAHAPRIISVKYAAPGSKRISNKLFTTPY